MGINFLVFIFSYCIKFISVLENQRKNVKWELEALNISGSTYEFRAVTGSEGIQEKFNPEPARCCSAPEILIIILSGNDHKNQEY